MVAQSGKPFPFPRNVNEALNPAGNFSVEPKQEEMDSHECMKTWGPPVDLTQGATSTNTRFLFSVKVINLSQNDTEIASKANKKVPRGDGGEYERY